MSDPNNPTEELLRLIDQALDIALSEHADPNNPDHDLLQRAIEVLRGLRKRTLAGELGPSNGLVTLGLVRGFSDVCADLNGPMMQALGAIEHHYLSNM